MKKLIAILTLCMFASITVATPIKAAEITSCNNTKNVTLLNINQCTKTSPTVSNCTGLKCNNCSNVSGSQCTANTCPTNTCVMVNGTTCTNVNGTACKNVNGTTCTKVNSTSCAKANSITPQVKGASTTLPNNIKVIKVVKKNCKAKKAKKSVTKVTTNNTTSTKPSTTTSTKPSTTTTSSNSKPATTSNTSTSSYVEFQKKVIELVNKERAAAGLSPLTEKSELDHVATLKSEDMVKLNYFSHTSPTYGSPFEMLTQFGIGYTAAGENIAYGQSTPEEVMNGWMNSPGHRANILNANFTQIGVGIAKKANGQLVWTQTFTRP